MTFALNNTIAQNARTLSHDTREVDVATHRTFPGDNMMDARREFRWSGRVTVTLGSTVIGLSPMILAVHQWVAAHYLPIGFGLRLTAELEGEIKREALRAVADQEDGAAVRGFEAPAGVRMVERD